MKRTKIIGIVFLIGLTLFIIGYLLGGLNHMQYIFFMTTFKWQMQHLVGFNSCLILLSSIYNAKGEINMFSLLAISSTAWIVGGSVLGVILIGAAVYYFAYYKKR